jgi:hypothetical protein
MVFSPDNHINLMMKLTNALQMQQPADIFAVA